MSINTASSGNIDPLHIGETAKEVWEKPFPNALLWPFKLIWKNIRPGVKDILEKGKDTAIGAITSTTRRAADTVMRVPAFPVPR